LSSPVGTIIKHLKELGKSKLDCRLILDTGSVKLPVEKAALEAGLGHVFVGGHPMAGGEKSGPKYADSELFSGKTYYLVKTEKSSDDALQEAATLVNSLGSDIVCIEASEHDWIVALTSHLPYLLAVSLARTAGSASVDIKSLKAGIAGGFRDMTRLADGSSKMWADILSLNHDCLIEWLELFIRQSREIINAAAYPDRLEKLIEEITLMRSKLLK
jgi:prephenate dehydrogenase